MKLSPYDGKEGKHHFSSVCTPSRAMLLTGANCHLTDLTNIPQFLIEG